MLAMYMTIVEDAGEQLRFEDIYLGYRKQMLLVAYRILGNQDDAEDAVQNALLGIARGMGKLPVGNDRLLRAYVLTVARNEAVRLLPKKEQRRSEVDISLQQIPAEEDVFRKVAAAQDYEGLLRAIRKLDPRYREVLMLVCVYEHSVREAAALLHRNVGTVRQQLNRGRKILVELCRKEGLIDE